MHHSAKRWPEETPVVFEGTWQSRNPRKEEEKKRLKEHSLERWPENTLVLVIRILERQKRKEGIREETEATQHEEVSSNVGHPLHIL